MQDYGAMIRSVFELGSVRDGGRYALLDMQDYETMQATICLMNELAQGRRSGETEGWMSPEEMRAHFRNKAAGEKAVKTDDA